MSRMPSEPRRDSLPSRYSHWPRLYADTVRALMVILFWSVVALAGLVAAFIAIRAIWWAMHLCSAALGLGANL